MPYLPKEWTRYHVDTYSTDVHSGFITISHKIDWDEILYQSVEFALGISKDIRSNSRLDRNDVEKRKVRDVSSQDCKNGASHKQSYRKCFTLHPNAFSQVFLAETRTGVVLSSRKYPLAGRRTALRDLSTCLVGCFEVAMCTPNIGAETPIACLMISEIIQALKTEGDLLGRYAETDLTHFARMVLTGWKQTMSWSQLLSLLYTLHRYFRSGGDVDSFYRWASCILPTGDNREDADADYDEDRERQDGIPRFE